MADWKLLEGCCSRLQRVDGPGDGHLETACKHCSTAVRVCSRAGPAVQ